MTRERYDIDEHRRRIFDRDGWRCQHPGCYESATEIAHLIGQGEHHTASIQLLWNAEYKESRSFAWIRANVIHHPLNVSASCRKHNDSFNIGFNPEAVRAKIAAIRDEIKSRGTK